MNHLAPKWFHEYCDQVYEWMRKNRVVKGLNIDIVDAPGGGKRIDAKPPAPKGTTDIWPFKPIATAKFKVRLKRGKVNHFTPTLMDNEFTLVSGDDKEIYAKATLSQDGTNKVTAVTLEIANSTPATDPPDEDTGLPPAFTYRGLAHVTADHNGLVDLDPLVKDSQWITVVQSGSDCSKAFLNVIWSSAGDGSILQDFSP